MYQLVSFSEQKDSVDRQRYEIAALGRAITNAESGQRGYLLTGHTLFLDTMEQGRVDTHTLVARLDRYATDLELILPELHKVKQLIHQKFDVMDRSIQVQMRAGSYASHLTVSKDKGREVMKLINDQLAQMDSKLQRLRSDYAQEIRQRVIESVIGAILLCMLIIGVLLFSYRNTTDLLEQMLETQAVTEQLSHQVDHDLLTGLPNRRSVDEHLETVFQRARHVSKPFAIFFMDLDGFKQVNDEYGHEIGDALLIEVASMFQRVLRQTDFLARQGGDEFVLVVGSYLHRMELVQLAQRLIQLFTRPVIVRTKALNIGVSIGIAEYPRHGKQVKQLLHAADQAMYVSKKNGKNSYSFDGE
ncbi:diguanylate cyclase domain-containing protein [Methylophilus sp.]|uniref:diguanylate cyclase domain-containing protein n=1 Tax=Methylophilus sp. TaxID=29541 RepID=UPI00403709D3